jgi:predicted nuclease of predicted toxin-antitoxin system
LKFIVDAQLPNRLCVWLRQRGHDCAHTKFLPGQNRTTDSQILLIVENEQRCVITKDGDFQVSFELGKGPKKLLLITTGNLPNDDLLAMFEKHETQLIQALTSHSFIELRRDLLIVHA